MKVNEYQEAALTTAIYRKELKVRYPSLGICGEAGEATEKAKKIFRDEDWDESKDISEERRMGAVMELGDVMWYTAVLAHDMGFLFSDILFQTSEDISSSKMDFDFVDDFVVCNVKLNVSCSMAAYYALTGDYEHASYNIKDAVSEIASLASFYGYTLDEVMRLNIKKLESRKQRDKINGDGDNR